MLEGNVVENTPEEWLRQIEDWVTTYPEERRGRRQRLGRCLRPPEGGGPAPEPTHLGHDRRSPAAALAD